MAGLFLVNCLDVARFFGQQPFNATAREVFERIEDMYLGPSGGGFNHDPVIAATYDVFRGAASAKNAIEYCRSNGNPKGRDQNTAIARVVAPYAASNVSRCYSIGFTAIVVGRYRGRSIHVGIKAPFFRVAGGRGRLVIPGYRKDSRPVGREIGLACSFASNQLARDDFETAEVEYLMAGPGRSATERRLQVLLGGELDLYSADQLDVLLQTYVDAVVMHLERGAGLNAPRLHGYRIIDPAQPRMI